ncbi:hypothetical protein LCGC14_0773540 [marine sediment metagenome]|uniref:PBP domain-containing protein n=1 Tax=marine sediment metagenome TaxID=412755 RepID=A0A0F9QHG5_9ZZZZ
MGLFGYISQFFVLMILTCSVVSADVFIVTNAENELDELDTKQIVDIFMGRTKFYPTGKRIVLVDQDLSSTVTETFYQKLVNKTINEINSYRSRLLFSGRSVLPRQLDDNNTVIEFLRHEKDAIGYIDLPEVTKDLKVIGHVK